MKYVVRLNEIGKDDTLLVGGKGANLGEMFQSQFPVPDGFCLTSESYDVFINENNFEGIIDDYLKKIYLQEAYAYKLSHELIDILSKGKLPLVVETEIKELYKKFGESERVAVRSSATAEDLPEASFAGQQETYLNIRGEKNLIDTIKKCFASLWSDRAIAYRKETGFDKKKISLAVVVQKMIESDVSGVLFTVNPTNQNKKEMMINASYGLGEAVVSGMVTPDTVIWDRRRNEISNKILGSKEISIIYEESGGTIQIDNDEEKRKSFAISTREIQDLTKLAEKIEKHYAYPQDIEWAIKNNKIYILQARAITTLENNSKIFYNVKNHGKRENKSKIEGKIINNLIEHYPIPIYPLEFKAFENVMKEKTRVFKELGIIMKDQIIMMDDGSLKINASSTYVSPRILKIPFKIKYLINYSNNMKHTQDVFADINNRISYLERKILNLNEYNYLENLTTRELLNLLKELMKMTKQIIYVRFRYNIFPSVILGKLIHWKLQKIEKGMTEYDLLGSLEYKTWKMNESIQKLAHIVNEDINLKDEILHLEYRNKDELELKIKLLASSYRKFGAYYNHVLDEFGWKSLNSYQAFSTVSWNEDKSHLIRLLRARMLGKYEKKHKNKYNEICRKSSNIFRERVAENLFKKFQQIRDYHINREESLYVLETCYGISRKIIRVIAKKYSQIFKNEKDILYLTLGEVYQLDKESNNEFFIRQIDVRRKTRRANRILWDKCEFNDNYKQGSVLSGVSGNRGKVSGKVCIINDGVEFSKLQEGDILVCKYTDPSWTPLFSLAKAVVSDTGGPLSHSAIVAREYNIPAVLGCGNATRVLKDGQNIIVNGDNGTVEIIMKY